MSKLARNTAHFERSSINYQAARSTLYMIGLLRRWGVRSRVNNIWYIHSQILQGIRKHEIVKEWYARCTKRRR